MATGGDITGWEAALFGLTQGLTEFLPVSSKGHLTLVGHALGWDVEAITFEAIWVHAATLLAVMVYYRQDLWNMLLGVISREEAPRDPSAPSPRAMIAYILIGTIPATLGALLIKDSIEAIFSYPRLTCGMLYVTGTLAIISLLERRSPPVPMNWWRAFCVGCAQACALLPGVSRSGTTIVSGLMLGIGREQAVRFSFLLSMPAIGGAVLLELRHGIPDHLHASTLFWSGLTAFTSGLVAVHAVRWLANHGKLWIFAPYCFAVATIGLIVLS